MSFNLKTFIFDTPLYTWEKIEDEQDYSELIALFNPNKSYDFHGYNPYEKIESTFKVTTDLNKYNDYYLKGGGVNQVNIKCKRADSIFSIFIYWNPEENTIKKIGQIPSVADFHIYEIKKYNKILSNHKLKEFTRAIGLAANGVGIGSFVYLRRIFEHLIYEAYEIALKNSEINEDEFRKARMDKKIFLLQHLLPEFLLENKELYSILSLGVHELDEKTCLQHFDALRIGIEIILDQKLEESKRIEKLKRAQDKIKGIKSALQK